MFYSNNLLVSVGGGGIQTEAGGPAGVRPRRAELVRAEWHRQALGAFPLQSAACIPWPCYSSERGGGAAGRSGGRNQTSRVGVFCWLPSERGRTLNSQILWDPSRTFSCNSPGYRDWEADNCSINNTKMGAFNHGISLDHVTNFFFLVRLVLNTDTECSRRSAIW